MPKRKKHPRRSVSVSAATYAEIARVAKRRGVPVRRIVEETLDWAESVAQANEEVVS